MITVAIITAESVISVYLSGYVRYANRSCMLIGTMSIVKNAITEHLQMGIEKFKNVDTF